MVKHRINARMGEDLLNRAKKEAKDRDISFSRLLRESLRYEIKQPTPIGEVRQLRQRVDRIEDMLADAIADFDTCIKDIHDLLEDYGEKNFDLIEDVLELLDKHVKVGH